VSTTGLAVEVALTIWSRRRLRRNRTGPACLVPCGTCRHVLHPSNEHRGRFAPWMGRKLIVLRSPLGLPRFLLAERCLPVRRLAINVW
jgi:hypothetical protein